LIKNSMLMAAFRMATLLFVAYPCLGAPPASRTFDAFAVSGAGRFHPEMKFQGTAFTPPGSGEVLRIQFDDQQLVSFPNTFKKVTHKLSVVRNFCGKIGAYVLREKRSDSREVSYYCLDSASTAKRLIFYRGREYTRSPEAGRQTLEYLLLEKGPQFVRVGHGEGDLFAMNPDESLVLAGLGGYHPEEFALTPPPNR
jgi:hypothetical protein